MDYLNMTCKAPWPLVGGNEDEDVCELCGQLASSPHDCGDIEEE